MSSLAPTPSSPLAPVTVGIVMGSSSDWEVMQHAVAILTEFHIPFEARVVSAHRMPLDMVEYGAQAPRRGMRAIIAGAGGAAHLPGMVAALTSVPVFGVPVPSKYLRGEDSLLSIVQMPKGVPVATFAIGEAGAANAALHVIANLATTDDDLRSRLDAFRARQTEVARAMALPITGLAGTTAANGQVGSKAATSKSGDTAATGQAGSPAATGHASSAQTAGQATQGGKP